MIPVIIPALIAAEQSGPIILGAIAFAGARYGPQIARGTQFMGTAIARALPQASRLGPTAATAVSRSPQTVLHAAKELGRLSSRTGSLVRRESRIVVSDANAAEVITQLNRQGSWQQVTQKFSQSAMEQNSLRDFWKK